ESLTVRMDDGRVYQTRFAESGGQTVVTTTFDPEQTHPAEMQRAGWQAILDRFRDYVEGRG
ncbi:MAG: activator of HSP90 ATPase, partial [Paracoccus sp. (in: a-proteobacteria)]|nr:activator of HSP90 ATPase [Paracoccus sp. (in: a-proteobacteria)]